MTLFDLAGRATKSLAAALLFYSRGGAVDATAPQPRCDTPHDLVVSRRIADACRCRRSDAASRSPSSPSAPSSTALAPAAVVARRELVPAACPSNPQAQFPAQ